MFHWLACSSASTIVRLARSNDSPATTIHQGINPRVAVDPLVLASTPKFVHQTELRAWPACSSFGQLLMLGWYKIRSINAPWLVKNPMIIPWYPILLDHLYRILSILTMVLLWPTLRASSNQKTPSTPPLPGCWGFKGKLRSALGVGSGILTHKHVSWSKHGSEESWKMPYWCLTLWCTSLLGIWSPTFLYTVHLSLSLSLQRQEQ